jgi:Protein of unknown function (DUF2599)
MRFARLTAAAVVGLSATFGAVTPAHAQPPPPPPYIDHTEWIRGAGLSSLHVYPTPAGRKASTDAVSSGEAWSEVLVDAPDADSASMRAQFECHWEFAEFVEPGKTSWNLEPWRPVVDDTTMVQTGCNPGGAEPPG